MATDLVKQASGRAHDAASWLESREPGSLLSELQSFARQRPAAFIALAAGAGLVAGRLGRGVKDATGDVGGVGAEESRPFASSQDSAYEAGGFQAGGFQAGAYQGVSSSEGGL